MFQMLLLYDKDNEEENFVEAISIKCSNFCRITGLYLKDKTIQWIINRFVLNTVLHHVGSSQIIYLNKHMKYYTKENSLDWLNKGPWYNKSVYSKLYGTVFEVCIRNDRTDRYNLMCCITEH